MALQQDASILGKKIIIGLIIYLIPAFIIIGGLRLVNHFFQDGSKQRNETKTVSTTVKH
jgi:hypothetical protein